MAGKQFNGTDTGEQARINRYASDIGFMHVQPRSIFTEYHGGCIKGKPHTHTHYTSFGLPTGRTRQKRQILDDFKASSTV